MEVRTDNIVYINRNSVHLSSADRLLAFICCVVIKMTSLLFKINGVKKILKFLKTYCKDEASYTEIRKAWYAVRITPGTQYLRFACLENSASSALYLILKRKKVVMHIGIRSQPLHSHCWLEYKGKPFQEIEDTSSLVKIVTI